MFQQLLQDYVTKYFDIFLLNQSFSNVLISYLIGALLAARLEVQTLEIINIITRKVCSL